MPPHPVLYDPLAGPLWTAFRISGTVVPKTLRHPAIWVFCAMNVLTFGLYNSGYLGSHSLEMRKEGATIISGITTFFEVFYTGACYSRFQRFWYLNKKMCQKIYDFVWNVRILTSPTGKPYDRCAARLVCIAHLVAMSRGEERGNVWTKLVELELATPEEAASLRTLTDPQRILVLTRVAGELAKVGVVEAQAGLNTMSMVITDLESFCDMGEEVEDLMQFPIPYEYFHLLNLMITINLGISAYFLGFTTSPFNVIFFFVQALIFMGMRELASQLADPFGDDNGDFPLHYWTVEFLENLSAMLDFQLPGIGENFENLLARETKKQTRFQLDFYEVQQILFDVGEEEEEPSGCCAATRGKFKRKAQRKDSMLEYQTWLQKKGGRSAASILHTPPSPEAGTESYTALPGRV